MPGIARREPRGAAGDVFSRFDRMFDEWARMMPFRAVPFPHWREADDSGQRGNLHPRARKHSGS